MHVTAPSDPAEREARAASQPASGPAPAITARPSSASRSPAATTAVAPDIGQQVRQRLGGGMPLPPSVAARMAPRLGADVSGVRLHTGPDAARLAGQLQAHAFTYGRDVFFGQDQYQPHSASGQALIAHELAHTIQQRDVIQRQESSTSVLAGAANTLKSAWDDVTDFSDSVGWTLVRQFAPSLEPIIHSGPEGLTGWLKDRAGAAMDGMVQTVTAPVHAVAGAGQALVAEFQPMALAVQDAAAKIARNDCSPLREAATKIEDVATGIITPIMEKVQPVVATIKSVASTLWTKIGVPVVDFIKEYASEKWQEIQMVWSAAKAIAGAIWDQTAAARALAGKAWTWLKNKLGIGEGAEGQDGLLQWAQRKLDAAWTWLKNLLAPLGRQLTVIGTAVGGVLIALSPAGPILAIGAAVGGAVKGLQWVAANWGKGDMIVQARVYLEKTLIPPLLGAARQLGTSISHMAASVSGALHGLATGLVDAARALGGDILAAVAAPVQWVADQITALADWAQGELAGVAQGMVSALGGLQSFMQNMLEFFAKVGRTVLDIYTLPVLLGEKIWNWVPTCIRDPIVDFLGPIILKQIELFSELGKDNEAWQKTKAEIGNLIKLVFKDHDLVGAVKAAFLLVLRVFNLPPDLLTTVWNKAKAGWATISKKPLDFLKNTVRSMSRGFGLMLQHIGTHLQFGLEGWLFGELSEKHIKPPASWTSPKDIFYFALDVLGLSVNHVFDLMKQRFPPEKVEGLRIWYGRIASVGAWIDKTIDVNKTPAENTKGLIDQAKDFGRGILTDMATWVTVKVSEELAALAVSAAASAGLSEVVDIARRIYKALVTAKRWARRLVDMANDTLDNIIDIASGAVEKVGTRFEGILHKAMPVVIGFLADQVGLGGVGVALREAVDKLRAKVDSALLWLIDKVKAGLGALIGLAKAGVAAVVDWWRQRRDFDVDGEPHSVYLTGNENNAEIVVASKPAKWNVFFAGISAYPSAGGQATLKPVQDAADRLRATMRCPATSFTPPLTKAAAVRNDLGALAGVIGPWLRLSPAVAGNLYPGSRIDPRTRSVASLWNDIQPAPPLLVGPPPNLARETQVDSEIRRVMARGKLLDQYRSLRPTAEAMIDLNLGREIKLFNLAQNEQTGHVRSRHVLNGQGEIKKIQDLALRVLLNTPDTGGNPASAFLTSPDAEQSIREGIQNHMRSVGGWPAFRETIIRVTGKADAIPGPVSATVSGEIFTKSPSVPSGTTNVAQLPAYLATRTFMGGLLKAAAGSNPLYQGDPNPGLSGPPLTIRSQPAGKVRIVMRTDSNSQRGGWYVMTAYPMA